MAISTQTEALIDLYTQKLELDKNQLEQVNYVQNGYSIKTGVGDTNQVKVWGSNEIIENFTSPIKKLDNEIIKITADIKNLQSQYLAIGQTANFNGCGIGITLGITTITVFEDDIRYRGYTYSGSNPFSPISGILTSGNSGIGTETYIISLELGLFFDIFIEATEEPCIGYATSLTNLENQIQELKNRRNSLISKVNFLKSGRSQYELQNYAYERSKTQINASIGVSSSILSFLEDPTNQEWL